MFHISTLVPDYDFSRVQDRDLDLFMSARCYLLDDESSASDE